MAIDPRPLSKRFDLAYVKRRHWPWNWLRLASVVLGLGAGLIAAALALRSDNRMHSPGPVAAAHSMFGENCALCHQPDPQRSGYWLPASDDACLACHNAVTHTDPHGHLFTGAPRGSAERLGAVRMSSDCTVCHNEHRGVDADLNHVADAVCIQCHGDLDLYESSGRTWSPKYRQAEVHEALAASEPTNPFLHIRDFERLHPQWRILAEERIDTTPLRFEHHVHMNGDTPRMDQRVAEYAAQRRAAGEAMPPVTAAASGAAPSGGATLACIACHEPDESGRYMKPMVFERHCQPCHGLGSKGGQDVPHGAGLDRFIAQIAAAKALEPPQAAPAAPSGPGAGPRRGPQPAAPAPGPQRGPQRGPAKPAAEEKPPSLTLDQVAEKVQREADTFQRMILPACARCHGVAEKPADIADPRMPARWLNHSRFDHSAHRFINCLECHRGADADAKHEAFNTRDPDAPQTKLKWTGRTREVMLPGVETCQRCHARPHRHLIADRHKDEFDPHIIGGVRFDCVTCHVYHGGPREVTEQAATAMPMTIDAFMPITSLEAEEPESE